MSTRAKQETCAEIVQRAFESRTSDIKSMLCLERDDVTLGDHGTLDTVIYPGSLDALIYGSLPEYRDDAGVFDMDAFLDDYFDEIRDAAYEQFCGYGLAFDYVEPGTFGEQTEGYLRFQISWGGPSEEFRFYVSPTSTGWALHRAEFWYLDWHDGAKVDCTDDATVRTLFEWFTDTDCINHAIENAG